jgi:nitrate reductase gamma subunit
MRRQQQQQQPQQACFRIPLALLWWQQQQHLQQPLLLVVMGSEWALLQLLRGPQLRSQLGAPQLFLVASLRCLALGCLTLAHMTLTRHQRMQTRKKKDQSCGQDMVLLLLLLVAGVLPQVQLGQQQLLGHLPVRK